MCECVIVNVQHIYAGMPRKLLAAISNSFLKTNKHPRTYLVFIVANMTADTSRRMGSNRKSCYWDGLLILIIWKENISPPPSIRLFVFFLVRFVCSRTSRAEIRCYSVATPQARQSLHSTRQMLCTGVYWKQCPNTTISVMDVCLSCFFLVVWSCHHAIQCVAELDKFLYAWLVGIIPKACHELVSWKR